MTWRYIKYSRDVAIYACCPNCGFKHNPSLYSWATGKTIVIKQFNYCPMCGEYLKDPNFKLNEEVKYEKMDYDGLD